MSMITVARRPQAVRLLPWSVAWKRAGLFAAQLAALAGLSWVFVITAVEVAAIAARISG